MNTITNMFGKFEEYRSTKLQSIEFLISTYAFFAVLSLIFGVLVKTGLLSI